jgi:hypothetical protein
MKMNGQSCILALFRKFIYVFLDTIYHQDDLTMTNIYIYLHYFIDEDELSKLYLKIQQCRST